jgi:eukaryotic-like serine/threonine-protein kinase
MPDMPDDPLPIRLAGAMTDGTDPDREAASTASTREEQQTTVEELRVLANLAAVHRGPGLPTSEDAATVPRERRAIWGPLELREEIGRGHFGTVYRAWDPALERQVALKLLRDSSGATEIIREGRLLARVRHPNVVTVYGVDQYDDAVGLWMEFVDGLTLSRVLAAGRVLEPNEAALVGVDVCAAVGAVHKAGLLHRDIKAQNVIREGTGRIVLMDFGAGEVRAGRTTAGVITGTPLYLAPEIFSGAPATIASDIYSIGVLLFHLVTSMYPVEGRSLEEVAAAHARNTRRSLADVRQDLPPGFVRIVERALEEDPARRYRSSDDMREDLTLVLPQQHAHAATAAAVARPPLIGTRTQNARAYHLYLKGRFYWTRRYHGGLITALEHFKKAIEEDAGYALAYAGVADAYAFMGIYAVQRPKLAFAEATAAVTRALTLDPDLPEAHTSLAFIRLGGDWDLPAAAREFTQALELDPRQAVTRIYYSWLLVVQGDVPAAMTQVHTAQETEPLSPLVNAGAGHTYYLARRYAEAIAECEKALEIDPNFILAIHVMGMCRALQGQLDEAIELAQRAASMASRAPFYLGVLGHYYARAGASDSVRVILEELQRTADQRYVPPHCMTFIYAAMNDLDRAFEWQAKAQVDGASPFYYLSPLIENLQGDPRHLEQMRSMGWKS